MKKTLVTILALVFVLGIAGTALAAPANPFVDVPAKHWAYGAVAQLAKAGIVDGYGDGTFRGDRAMTRYEMAQVVAKAMARSEKADAQQKALIDKLAVEFAAELNSLGVRVAKLEANASSIKFYGDARIRYFENLAANNDGTTNTQQRFQERLRIYMDAKVADNVTFAGRLSAQNASTEGAAAGNAGTTIDFAKFTFKDAILGADFQIGRDSLGLGYGLISNGTGQYDSFKFIGGGKEVKFWLGYGDLSSYLTAITGNGGPAWATAAATNSINVTTANVNWAPAKTFQLNFAGYWSNSKYNTAGSIFYPYKTYAFGVKYNFAPDFWLTSELARNTSNNTANQGQRSAMFAQIGYKGADKAVAGSWGLFLNYKKYGAAAIDWRNTSIPVFENVNDGFLWQNGNKGWGIAANYALTKNVIGTITYEDLKSYDGSIKRPKFTYVRMELWF